MVYGTENSAYWLPPLPSLYLKEWAAPLDDARCTFAWIVPGVVLFDGTEILKRIHEQKTLRKLFDMLGRTELERPKYAVVATHTPIVEHLDLCPRINIG